MWKFIAFLTKTKHHCCFVFRLYTRSTKRNGAWMTSFRKQSINEKEKILSLWFPWLNYSAPTNNNPTLLTYDEFRTFLHEFGHALHGMLSTIRYQSLSRTSVLAILLNCLRK